MRKIYGQARPNVPGRGCDPRNTHVLWNARPTIPATQRVLDPLWWRASTEALEFAYQGIAAELEFRAFEKRVESRRRSA